MFSLVQAPFLPASPPAQNCLLASMLLKSLTVFLHSSPDVTGRESFCKMVEKAPSVVLFPWSHGSLFRLPHPITKCSSVGKESRKFQCKHTGRTMLFLSSFMVLANLGNLTNAISFAFDTTSTGIQPSWSLTSDAIMSNFCTLLHPGQSGSWPKFVIAQNNLFDLLSFICCAVTVSSCDNISSVYQSPPAIVLEFGPWRPLITESSNKGKFSSLCVDSSSDESGSSWKSTGSTVGSWLVIST